MVKIRLKRQGRKKRPFYRIVAIDSHERRDGKEIERLGWYNPIAADEQVNVKFDAVMTWLDKGAQVTDTIRTILKGQGIWYLRHLQKMGKSEEDIAKAMEEWRIKHGKVAPKADPVVAEPEKKEDEPLADEDVDEKPAEEDEEAE